MQAWSKPLLCYNVSGVRQEEEEEEEEEGEEAERMRLSLRRRRRMSLLVKIDGVEEEVVFTRENRGESAQHATREHRPKPQFDESLAL